MVWEVISSEPDHWVCDLGWSCGLHGLVWVLVLGRGSAYGWRWTNRQWYRRWGMGRRLVEDVEGHILQLFLDLTDLCDQLDTVVAGF